METLHNWFLAQAQEALQPERIISQILIQRIKQSGITLNADQETAIVQQLQANGVSDRFTLTLTDEQEQEAIKKGIDPNNIQINLNDFQIDPNFLDDIFTNVADIISTTLVKSWIEHAPEVLREQEEERKQFEAHLVKKWERPIQFLDALISICHDTGAEFNEYFRTTAAHSNDLILEALTRLHARGCQVALEALTLLQSGFADGAHARWRTLHEITVTAMFVAKHGQDAAERFLEHSAVSDYYEAQQYQQYCTLLSYEPLSNAVVEQLRLDKEKAVQKFGPQYDSDYGWAARALRRNKPRFTDIERDVNLNHLRPFYKLANMNIHAGAKSILHRLGSPPHDTDMLLSGRSIFGLEEPGQNIAVSIYQLTATLLLSKSNIDCIVRATAINSLMNEVVWAFDEFMMPVEEVETEADAPIE